MKNIFIGLTCFILLFFIRCKEKETSAGRIISDQQRNAYYPQVSLDHLDEPYIWWVEEIEKSGKNMVYYARSKDEGKSFEQAVSIPFTKGCSDSHGEGTPKLI